MAADRFTWVPFMEELADKLLGYRDDRQPLVKLLEGLEQAGLPMGLLGTWRADIDPFTFLAALHRGLQAANRAAIAAKFKEFFGLAAAVPADYDGLPTASSQRARLVTDVTAECDVLWRVLELALQDQPLKNAAFLAAVDEALRLRGVANNLLIGLFWVRPQIFVPSDAHTRKALADVQKLSSPIVAANYAAYVAAARAQYPDIVQFSADAWADEPAGEVQAEAEMEGLPEAPPEPCYWFVGSMWHGNTDKTMEFVHEGVWQDHWPDGPNPAHSDYARILQMRPGERIAIKSSYVRKHNLPFATKGKAASVLRIKATGTIVHNPQDGTGVSVRWDPMPTAVREWYFFTNQTTIWRLGPNLDPKALGLVNFAFFGEAQDFDWYLTHPYWSVHFGPHQPQALATGTAQLSAPAQDAEGQLAPEPAALPPYTVQQARDEGVFLDQQQLELMVEVLGQRKNIILQGPPGVGKTYVADKLAYLLIGQERPDRVLRVQFHQSMSYEDFVQGLQPVDASWRLTAGKFMAAAELATLEDVPFVVIIDEINRGNPSAIFGELLTLLEADKRTKLESGKRTDEFGIQLRGSPPDTKFQLPSNLYLIGTMNRADRSLAPLDAALRRRFAFFSIKPNFDVDFQHFVARRLGEATGDLMTLLGRVTTVNGMISADPHLGPDALIGHSYFCKPPHVGGSIALAKWFDSICKHDLIPLLQELWFSPTDKAKLAEACKTLGVKNVEP